MPHRKVTHRCRVYRIESEPDPGEFIYTMVSDTLEDPVKDDALPDGELYLAVSNQDQGVIKDRMYRLRRDLGRVEVTDWRARGSI